MKKILLVLGVLVVLGGAVFVVNKKADTIKPEQKEQEPEQSQQKNLPPIAIDLSGITPQFVDDREADPENPVPLPEDLKKIKKAVIDMYVARDKVHQPTSGYGEKEFESQSREFNSRLILLAVDKKYVLAALPGPVGYGDALIDIANGSELFIDHYAFKTKTTMVYILSDKISYYKPGQSSFLTLANSELAPPETYMSSTGAMIDVPNETHTEKAITLSVYDSSKWATQEKIEHQKIREVTYNLP